MVRWNSLYLSFDDTQQLEQAIDALFNQLSYKRYHPFGLIPGIAYPITLKFFIAPPQNGWTRLLIEASHSDDLEQVLHSLSEQTLGIFAHLSGSDGDVQVYQNGQSIVPTTDILADYKDPNVPVEQLQAVLDGEVIVETVEDARQIGVVSLDDLPPDVQMMAGGLKDNNIERMFSQLTDRFMGASTANSASKMLQDLPDWNSPAGQKIRSWMTCLSVPENWQEPDFPTLRVAYPLYTRLERNPDAMMYPGDEESMQAIPNALDYVPIYGGKDH